MFAIEAPILHEMILNAALALLFYVCGHGFLFQSCSIRNPQYPPEVWHKTPGTLCVCTITTFMPETLFTSMYVWEMGNFETRMEFCHYYRIMK
jgi:hypothetical protein